MEETQTCCQMHIIKIAFSIRLQKSCVSGFGVLPLGWLGNRNSVWQKLLRCQPSVSLHITISQEHLTKPVGKMEQRKLEALTPTVPDKDSCWTASI